MKIRTFKAFNNPNFRLYFLGQSISLIGTWMQRTAVYWVIFDQTNSNFMLGLIVFATQFPSFLFSPLGGVITDRYNRYKLTLITQFSLLIQAALLTLVVLFTDYPIWTIFALSVIQGIINAFDLPARQSLVNEIVKKRENLSNAIALNSSMGKLAWLIGPAISGIILKNYGAGICFMINAFSYLAVILSIIFIRITPFTPEPKKKDILKEIKEGFKYVKSTYPLNLVILLLAFVSLFVLPFNTLLPVFAKVVFKGDASTFGYLTSSLGAGALLGAIFLASISSRRNRVKLLLSSLFILGTALILFSSISNFPIALIFASIAGFSMMFHPTLCNTIIQVEASDEMRGRALSFFAMAFFGLQPIGGLIIGSISHFIGAPKAILSQGICALLIGSFFTFFLRKKKQRIK